MNAAERDALVALVQWWRMHRPIDWTIADHWKSPSINTAGTDAALARAAALVSRIDAQREHPRYNQATLET